MTPTEISRRLALVIGYAPEDVCLQEYRDSKVLVRRHSSGWWWVFDYQDVEVIYPIAEHFKMMPVWLQLPNTWRNFLFLKNRKIRFVDHTDPRTCIALAVIEASEMGLLS
jgi:hypothetical protein